MIEAARDLPICGSLSSSAAVAVLMSTLVAIGAVEVEVVDDLVIGAVEGIVGVVGMVGAVGMRGTEGTVGIAGVAGIDGVVCAIAIEPSSVAPSNAVVSNLIGRMEIPFAR